MKRKSITTAPATCFFCAKVETPNVSKSRLTSVWSHSRSVYRSSKSLAQTLCRQSAASAVWTLAPGFGTAAGAGEKTVVHSVQTTIQASRIFFCFHLHTSPKAAKNCHIVLCPCTANAAATHRLEIADNVEMQKEEEKTLTPLYKDYPYTIYVRFYMNWVNVQLTMVTTVSSWKYLQHLPNSMPLCGVINHFPALCAKRAFIWGSKYCLFPKKKKKNEVKIRSRCYDIVRCRKQMRLSEMTSLHTCPCRFRLLSETF